MTAAHATAPNTTPATTVSPERLGFKRHLQAHVIDNEAVYLVSENSVSALHGRLAAQLSAALDGTRTTAELVDALAGEAGPQRVHAALDQMHRTGLLTTVRPETDARAAGYFELAGIDGDRALSTLRAAVVRVEWHSESDPAPVLDALTTAGVSTSRPREFDLPDADLDSALVLVVVDDYLQPEVAQHNLRALRTGRPWLLARPSGATVWLGPTFVPGQSGCWSCLAARLEANRQSLSYLQQRLDRAAPLVPAGPRLPVAAGLGAHLLATEVVRVLTSATPDGERVLTLDTHTMKFDSHQLVRRPQCAECGDPALQTQQGLRPVVLHPQPKVHTADGGHRSTTPEEMLATYRPQLSPITGVVTSLTPAAATPDGVRVYVAGQNLARQVGDLRALRRGLRSMSAGKGKTDAQARASAMGEAIERYSGVFRGDEARRRASLDDLGELGLHPNDAMLFSERQYSRRNEQRAGDTVTSTFHAVPERFDPARQIDFSPVWSLSEQRHRWLPTSYLYYSTPAGDPTSFADSNGNAGGTSIEDAILQGFFELVERDAVAIWWYNRLRRPAIDLDSFADPYIDRLRTVYADINREIWALDLTTDLGIPAVGAFSRRVDKPAEDILIAFGAHFDPQIALNRALTELNQFVGPSAIRDDGTGRYVGDEPEQVHWWQTATLANQPYLSAHADLAAATPSDWVNLAGDDLARDVDTARDLVERQGLQMLVLDQTRPDIGLPVVKVIVPGLRHFWTRYGAGRLYDVPVSMGWLDQATAEDDLNPIPIFI